jgi:membrane associated rhomboid family serine protease
MGVISYLSNGESYNLFVLNPSSMILHGELWRLFTFSFLPNSIEGIILVAIVFWLIAPELETKFQTKKFVLLTFLVIALQGAIFTLLFWNKNVTVAGAEGIAFFILTLFMFLEVTNKNNWPIRINRSLHFVVFIPVVWFASVILHNTFSDNIALSNSIISAAYGIIFGGIMFVQMKAVKHIINPRRQTTNPVNVPTPEELIGSLSMQKESSYETHFEEDYENDFPQDIEEYFSEERLNQILDKINEYGKDSLTPDEKLYLKEYSQYL